VAEIKWIKIVTDIFDDEKIKAVERLQNRDKILLIWLRLLCGSKLKNSQGLQVYKIANIDLTDDVLATVFGYNGEDISDELAVLESHGFIKREQKQILVMPFWVDRHDRNSTRYREWRNAVFERDKYICQGCNTKKNLQAHHIVHWSDCKDNIDLRYATENGITLCRKCHLEAHGGAWR
jgi:predicted phage replisome organizer